jgi:hypothetical protein
MRSGLLGQIGAGLLIAAACSSDSKSSGGGTGGAGCVVCGLDGGGDAELVDGSSIPPGQDLIPISQAGEAGILLMGDAACQGTKIETEAGPTTLQMVVDVSGSMNATTDSTGGRSKWAVTRDALVAATAALPANIAVGVTFYPNMATSRGTTPRNPTACVNQGDDVAIAPLGTASSQQRTDIDNAFATVAPNSGGGTPTYDAYSLALPPLQTSTYSQSKYMLLITDGQPTFSQNCVGTGYTSDPVDPAPIVDLVTAAFGAGVKTFVIGSPGSEQNVSTNADSRAWLSQAARVGGTAPAACSDSGSPEYCHFDMTQAPDFSAALTAALKAITNTIIPCVYPVNPPPGGVIDYAKVNLIYTDASQNEYAVVKNLGTTCDRGWHYINNNTEIEVCGDTCTKIKADSAASMEVLFGCEPISSGVY